MASCVGCGCSVEADKKHRLLLRGPAVQHEVYTLWEQCFEAKVTESGRNIETFKEYLSSQRVYLCRTCKDMFIKLHNMQQKVSGKLDSAIPAIEASLQGDTSNFRKRRHPAPLSSVPSAKRPLFVGSSPPVVVTVPYKTTTKNYVLTPSRKPLGKMIARGSHTAIARLCLNDPKVKSLVLRHVLVILRKEVSTLCSDRVSSCMLGSSPEEMCEFNASEFIGEARAHAPTLLSILETLTKSRSTTSKQSGITAMILAMLCKCKRPRMSLLQKILSVLLYFGHCSKKAFMRLQSVGVTMSYRSLQSIITRLGENHDKKVLQWCDKLKHFMIRKGQPSQANTSHSSASLHAISSHDISLESSIYSSPIAPQFEVDSCDDMESQSSTAESASSTQSGDDINMDDVLTATPDHGNGSQQYQAPSDSDGPSASTVRRLSESSQSNIPSQFPQSTLPSMATSACGEQSPNGDLETYIMIGDNVDFTIIPTYMRSNKQKLSLHCFQSCGIKDRVDLSSASTSMKTTKPTLTAVMSAVYPSKDDNKVLLSNLRVLISRILINNVPYFNFTYSDLYPSHISHKYSNEMSMKSEVVPLGVICKNENKANEMCDILDDLVQSYSPSTTDVVNTEVEQTHQDTKVHPIPLGGDQLTVARVRSAQKLRSNEYTSVDRLEGVIPFAQDWHTFLAFLELIWKWFYNQSASCDHGTLCQLKNLINRRNVKTHPKEDFRACDDFLRLVVTGHVVAAAMQVLNINSISDTPLNCECDWILPASERSEKLNNICDSIIKRFITLDVLVKDIESEGDKSVDGGETSMDGEMADEEDINQQDTEGRQQKPHQDGVLQYAQDLLSVGMLYLEYQDGVKEGDGERVMRCLKYLLPLFKVSGKKNYSIEVLQTLFNVGFVLSDMHKLQCMYGRFVNTQGRVGCNIPADEHLEHLNRVCKDSVSHLKANKSEKSIQRVGKCVGIVSDVSDRFDEHLNASKTSDRHCVASAKKDLEMVVKELTDCKTFIRNDSRRHLNHKKTDLLSKAARLDMKDWIKQHTKL